MKGFTVTILAIAMAHPITASAIDQPAFEPLAFYRQQGITLTNADNGKLLWQRRSKQRSCTACHGSSPADLGKHVRTGKPIEPMALSANPQRYRDAAKVEKWFKRNCKWTFGRECSAQEKADILAWLTSL